MYAYCNNDPVTLSDQLGNTPLTTITQFDRDGYRSDDSWAIKYDVPLLDQGRHNLCWANCMLMVFLYRSGKSSEEIDCLEAAKSLGEIYNGKEKWDSGVIPSRISKKARVDTVSDLFLLLYENGPLYAYYVGNSGSHLVVVTGVDIDNGYIYTNNPQYVNGCQTFDEFFHGYVGLDGKTTTGYDFRGIYIPN